MIAVDFEGYSYIDTDEAEFYDKNGNPIDVSSFSEEELYNKLRDYEIFLNFNSITGHTKFTVELKYELEIE